MMKKKLLKILAVACSLTCIATASIGSVLSKNTNLTVAKAYEISLGEGSGLLGDYAYGDLLSIPMGTIDGQPTTKAIVLSPTGIVYETASVNLLEEGQYTIVWYATVGGKEVTAKKSFFVTKSAFTMDGIGAYGYMESLERANGVDGIKVSLEAETTFRYNTVIDLADTSTTTPFAKLYPYQRITNLEEAYDDYQAKSAQIKKELQDKGYTDKEEINEEIERRLGSKPAYKYSEDARNYLITLTDRYDPSNYVTIDLEWLEKRTYWNFRAAAVGQKEHGLRGPTNDKKIQENKIPDERVLEYNGEKYIVYYAPDQGVTSCNKTDDKGLEFYYDVETNRIYTTFYRYQGDENTETPEIDYLVKEKIILADLSSQAIYPDNAFKGFTTGEVYFSISAKNYLGNTANVDIESLGGVSGRDLMYHDMHDTKAPVIEVDEDLRNGSPLIALNEEIEIPSAIAHDLSLPYGTKATTSVYYSYNPNSNKNVLVGLSDGKFTPQKAGAYTIVYSATDTSGNVGTATVALQCSAGVDNKAVKLMVDESIEGVAGTTIQIPECTITGLYSDASAIKTYVQFEGGQKTLLTGTDLFLKGVGSYVLIYEYETPFKTYTATCNITASASNKITLDTPIVPEYFIKGAKYTLDAVYAYEYTAKEPVAVETKVYMSADNGNYVEVNRKEVLINASNTVQFKYAHNSGLETYSDKIQVLDVGFGVKDGLEVYKYFHSEDNAFTGEATPQGVRYFADGTQKNATLKYINTLSLSSFAFEFQFLKEIKTKGENDQTIVTPYVKPESITLTLVDYYDRDNKVTLSFKESGASTQFSINGEHKTKIATDILANKFAVSYTNGFIVGGKTYAWDGAFTSDRILLWVNVDGIVGDTCLEMGALGIGTLKKVKNDTLKPVIVLSELNGRNQSIGTVITIARPMAYDLIAPYVESGLTLKVTKPDGSVATSLDGVVLDEKCSINRSYQIKLEAYGTYVVTYTYVDQNGEQYIWIDRPEVVDEQGPTLTVDGITENQVFSAEWCTTVKVASFTASDNMTVDDALKSWVCVFCPSGIIRQVTDGTFYTEEKGKYTVFYQSVDEMGNYTSFRYYVTVE